MSGRVVDLLRKASEYPAVVYYVKSGRPRPYTKRGHVVQRLQSMNRRELEDARIFALDAYPEPGQIGWREVTGDFISIGWSFNDTKVYGIILADGTVQSK
ncbi:hypothetical protein AB0G15_05555 [Streptosporangium sp. NPDC023825]|uniref:hypothetical protein n=1 Tax=Streptosporangium sp. NPDC023825 TaxID=3154909 RepID=UPI00343DB9B2